MLKITCAKGCDNAPPVVHFPAAVRSFNVAYIHYFFLHIIILKGCLEYVDGIAIVKPPPK